jgi:hypothetical protein
LLLLTPRWLNTVMPTKKTSFKKTSYKKTSFKEEREKALYKLLLLKPR